MAAPAMKLTLIIESAQDPQFIPRLIPLLTEMPLDEDSRAALRRAAAAAAARTPPAGPGADPQPRRGTRRDHLLRHHRPSAGRFQQIHPVLPLSQRHLLDRPVQIELSHQGSRGIEPVDQGRPGKDGEPGAKSASAMAEAGMRAWAPSASRPTRRPRRAWRPRRLWRNCESQESGISDGANRPPFIRCFTFYFDSLTTGHFEL